MRAFINIIFCLFQVALALVWCFSGIYCLPKLIFFTTIEHQLSNDVVEVICLADRKLYNSKIYDTINFFLLYIVPLTVISIFYWKIGRYLWVNGSQIEERFREELSGSSPRLTVPCTEADQWKQRRRCLKQLEKEQQEYENRPLNVRITGSNSSSSRYSFRSDRIDLKQSTANYTTNPILNIGPYHSQALIRTWRKVIKLLVAVVLCFALCNLPLHFRKMLSYYYNGYSSISDYALLATPITNLLTYLNSALNPLLYSFMSHNFRLCVRDVLACRYTLKGKRRLSARFLPQNVANPLQLDTMKPTKIVVSKGTLSPTRRA